MTGLCHGDGDRRKSTLNAWGDGEGVGAWPPVSPGSVLIAVSGQEPMSQCPLPSLWQQHHLSCLGWESQDLPPLGPHHLLAGVRDIFFK